MKPPADAAVRRRWATLASATGLVLVLTACGNAGDLSEAGTSSPSPNAAPKTQRANQLPPPTPPPRTGACRALRPDDIPPTTNTTRTTPCRSRHTAVTFFVGRFKPAMLSGTVPSTAAKTFAATRCLHRFYVYSGGGPAQKALSLLDIAYFFPSARQLGRHANWFRCDVVSGYDLQRVLYPLPAHLRGSLSNGVPDDVRECVTKRFGAPGVAYVPCTRRHVQRAIAVLSLGGPDTPFPSTASQKSRISSWCGRRTAAYLGYPSGRYFWGYQWLSRREWTDGDRFGKCFAVTAS
jgi:Septum formation